MTDLFQADIRQPMGENVYRYFLSFQPTLLKQAYTDTNTCYLVIGQMIYLTEWISLFIFKTKLQMVCLCIIGCATLGKFHKAFSLGFVSTEDHHLHALSETYDIIVIPNSNRDDSGSSLPVVTQRTNLKLPLIPL